MENRSRPNPKLKTNFDYRINPLIDFYDLKVITLTLVKKLAQHPIDTPEKTILR